MNLKSGFVRVLAILAFAIAICSSSQAAQPSSTGSGRLVVQRSPAFGSKEFLRLSIDGKVHDIAPGSRYDQPISAGHHVLIADAPRSQRQPTSMSLTVDPGHTYAFTATRETDQGVSLKRSSRIPQAGRKKPFFGLRNAFSVDLSLKTGSDLGMSARIIQVRPSRNPRWQKQGEWEVYEGDGVSPVYCDPNAREDVLSYARQRAGYVPGAKKKMRCP